MGTTSAALFATLDLVGQAPGGPEEDPSDEFAFGGWQAPLLDDVSGAQVDAAYRGVDALLLGRRTYDVFAGYWPHRDDSLDGGFAELFNRIPKHVASRGTPELTWAGSELLGPDLPAAVRALRDRHEHVMVVGSLDLVQTLLAERLLDVVDLWLHPVVLGQGKKVFAAGAAPTSLELLAPPEASPSGVVHLRYGLRAGVPGTGDMSEV